MAGLSGAVRTRERSNSARARGLELVRATGLTGMVRRASDHAAGGLGTERLLPVAAELRGLLPGGGLRRGATVAVDKDATSLLLALMAAASQAGSWCAVVGVPTLSAAAAAEAGIALDRLALVPNPGPGWTGVVGALLDGLDIVVVAVPGPIAPTVSGRLTARARQRGSVLVSYGDWRGADVTLDVVSSVWHGLGAGCPWWNGPGDAHRPPADGAKRSPRSSGRNRRHMRTMVVWCPDWPVIAAEIVDGVPVHEPVAVLHVNRVLACSPAARAEGIRRGLRKREAQARCPQLVVVDHDGARDARAFEPVVAAVEELAPGVEVVRPGVCALAARGPARYFGGEAGAAERLVEHIAQTCGVEAQIGVADGVFAGTLAARAGRLIPPKLTPLFLAGLDIAALGRPALADLLRRLGVRTLGDFAALPATDVLARFGFDAALAHRQACGRDEQPLAPRQQPPDLDVTATFDEPVERVDTAAFAAKALGVRLHQRLTAHGLACTRLAIEACTAAGQELHRTWRHDGLLSAAAIGERVRWQLDGWLIGRATGRPGR